MRALTLLRECVMRLRGAFSLRGPEPVVDDGLLADATNLHEVERRLREFDRMSRTPHARTPDSHQPA